MSSLNYAIVKKFWKRTKWHFISGVIIVSISLLVLVVGIRFLYPHAKSIEVSIGEGKYVKIEMQDGKTEYADLINELFQNEASRMALSNELKIHYDMYHIDDVDLAQRLSELLPTSTEDDVVARCVEMNNIIEEHPVIKALREKSKEYQPPFQFVGKKVKIGVPAQSHFWPNPGLVNVPFESQYVGRIIELRNKIDSRKLILRGRAAFAKTDNVDMQLNRKQAVFLFDRIIHTTTEGVAFILQEGVEIYDPTGQE